MVSIAEVQPVALLTPRDRSQRHYALELHVSGVKGIVHAARDTGNPAEQGNKDKYLSAQEFTYAPFDFPSFFVSRLIVRRNFFNVHRASVISEHPRVHLPIRAFTKVNRSSRDLIMPRLFQSRILAAVINAEKPRGNSYATFFILDRASSKFSQSRLLFRLIRQFR